MYAEGFPRDIQFGPSNLIKKIENDISTVRFWIATPPGIINIGPYLKTNASELHSQIRGSNLISHSDSHKIAISCYSKYYKYNDDDIPEYGGIYHHTSFILIPAYSGALENNFLNYLINEIGNKQHTQSDSMEGSNWVFLGVVQILITFIRLDAGNAVQIKNYIPYPTGFRGNDCIINPNYNYFHNESLYDDISPCVLWALRVYKLLRSPNYNEKQKEKDLQTMSKPKLGIYPKDLEQRLAAQQIVLPQESIMDNHFNSSHWLSLEKCNNFPIAVYYLKNSSRRVECIRAPSPKILHRYGMDKICNLLMIAENHVVYITDIIKYLRSATDRFKATRPLCQFCFQTFLNNNILTDHLNNGVCYTNTTVPPQYILEQDAYLPHKNPINEIIPELTFVADVEAFTSNNEHATPTDGSISDEENELDAHDITEPRPAGKISTHVPHSIGIISLDHNNKKIEYRMLFEIDVANKFIDTLLDMARSYKENTQNKIIFPKPILTKEQEKQFQLTKNCKFCNIEFSKLPPNFKHRHHCHYTEPEFDTFTSNLGMPIWEVVKGNYLGALCNSCNWKATSKRRTMNVLIHNLQCYDGPLLISGMLNSKIEDLKNFSILPKGSTAYHFIQYKNIKLIDSLSFMQGSLSSLVELKAKNIDPDSADKKIEDIFPITVSSIQESDFDNRVIKHMVRKLVYPYNLAKKIEDFKLEGFPKKSDFYDQLSETHISDQDYNFAKEVFEISGCKTLKNMHDLYLLTDVCLLADCWVEFNNIIFKDFGLYAANFLSAPGLSFRAALKHSGTDIRLLEDFSMFELYNQSIRGGFTCVNRRQIKCNNIDMGDSYDPSKPDSTAIMIDFNSLYAECLSEPLPYADFKYLDRDILDEYEKDPNLFMKIDISKTAKKGYFVTLDLEIPESLALLTDDMPLGIIKSQSIKASPYTQSIGGDKASQEKLIAGHFNLRKYSLDIRLLNLYISLGVKITKIHSIISYLQKPLFAEYIQHCASQRKIAQEKGDPVMKRLWKLLPNSLYGKSLQNDLFYNTKRILVENGPRFRKLCSRVNFKSFKWLVKDKIALVTLTKTKIAIKSPIFIGATVLQLSKLKNLSFDIQVAKASCANFPHPDPYPIRFEDEIIIKLSRLYIYSCQAIYMDTDSICYYIIHTEASKGKDHEFLFRNTFLSKYLDRSNFKVLSRTSYCEPGDLGFLKSEVSDSPIHEAIFLTPKCYSILAFDRGSDSKLVKSAIKGCPTSVAARVYTHQIFRNMIESEGYKPPLATSNHIRRDRITGVNTIRVIKNCLSLIDNKHYWVDFNTSYAYGNPEIKKLSYKNGDIIASSGAIIKGTEDSLLFPNRPISIQDYYEGFPDFFQVDNVEEQVSQDNSSNNTISVASQESNDSFPDFLDEDIDGPINIQDIDHYNFNIDDEDVTHYL